MSKPLERYQKLALKECLGSIHRYPLVCKELSLILRGAYRKVPKNLQSLIFQDTLTAFRLLPEMKTGSAVSAAHLLLQSVEATLPKQKKNLAVAEYKNAMVVHKRRTKAHQEENLAHLPQDVLVHVFSFLDFQSLVSVGLVCWSWNFAASDNRLWQRQYATFFRDSYNDLNIKEQHTSRQVQDKSDTLFWRKAFKIAYKGNSSSEKLKSSRGYCRHCKTIVWLDNMKCFNEHIGLNTEIQKIDPVLPSQVVDYLLEGSISLKSSSESDSDSDSEVGLFFSRLWAYAYQRPLTRPEDKPSD
ncbi:PREDICTED: F-box protein At5g52880 [Fragaria vesca subsp. vesca]|uniref:F-box protein At5g52880 n=1 Tax=Fragaria vesca subsp. vesca TaxID=101020 RepID=UPI0002C332C8|nr:PREDICTED: F-box protein At5g52880 [Fragaria vesca subsp. vesca]